MVSVAPMPQAAASSAWVAPGHELEEDGGLLSSRAQRSGYLQKASSPRRPVATATGSPRGRGAKPATTLAGSSTAVGRAVAVESPLRREGRAGSPGERPGRSMVATGAPKGVREWVVTPGLPAGSGPGEAMPVI
jgi:hypothetical protein